MNRFTNGLMAASFSVIMAGCGGGDDSPQLPTAEALCSSIGLTPKVINGSNCSQPERAAVILLNVQSTTGTSVCSGTLIAPTKILTAAHCLPAGTSRVLVGVWGANGSVVGRPARAWAVHPQFARTNAALVNDAAVIVMSTPMPNPTMAVMVGATTSAGQGVYIAGWGAPGFDLAVGFTSLTAVNDTSLRYTYTGTLSNTCGGDSGGPVYRNSGGRPAVVGITSSGTASNCGDGEESLSTNVQSPAVINFIRSQAPEASYL